MELVTVTHRQGRCCLGMTIRLCLSCVVIAVSFLRGEGLAVDGRLAGRNAVNGNTVGLSIAMVDGSHRDLASYRGKVTVLVFLLTGCPHCREVAKLIGEVQRGVGSDRLSIVGIAVNEDAKGRLREFIEKTHAPFPVGYAPLTSALSYLKINPTERALMPRVVILDPAGETCVSYSGLDDVFKNKRDLVHGSLLKLVRDRSCSRLSRTAFPAPVSTK